jgi:ABC-2 type transport system ATP-binding protein
MTTLPSHSRRPDAARRHAVLLTAAVVIAWIAAAIVTPGWFVSDAGPVSADAADAAGGAADSAATTVTIAGWVIVALMLGCAALTWAGRAGGLLVVGVVHAIVAVALMLSLGVWGGAIPLGLSTVVGLVAGSALFAGIIAVGASLVYSRIRLDRLAARRREGDLAGDQLARMPGMQRDSGGDGVVHHPRYTPVRDPETRRSVRGRLADGVPAAYTPGPTTLIEVTNLVKHYGPTVAVDDVSFSINRGEIVGFLGPNGAGKSTTMKVLTTYLDATAGRATVAGFDVAAQPLAVRNSIGYLPESNPLYREMRVRGYLTFIAKTRGLDRATRDVNLGWVRAVCGLEPVWDVKINELSKGFRQRVGLAQAMVHQPDILILDEPSSGLDPNQIIEMRELIREFAREKTVILSTHILQEVTALCSRVMIIDQGKLAANGSVADLSESIAPLARYHVRAATTEDRLRDVLGKVDGVGAMATEPIHLGEGVELVVSPSSLGTGESLGEKLAAACNEAKLGVQELRRVPPSLEDVFVTMTGRGD